MGSDFKVRDSVYWFRPADEADAGADAHVRRCRARIEAINADGTYNVSVSRRANGRRYRDVAHNVAKTSIRNRNKGERLVHILFRLIAIVRPRAARHNLHNPLLTHSGFVTVSIGNQSKSDVLVLEPLTLVLRCQVRVNDEHRLRKFASLRLFFDPANPSGTTHTIRRSTAGDKRSNIKIYFRFTVNRELLDYALGQFTPHLTAIRHPTLAAVQNHIHQGLCAVFQDRPVTLQAFVDLPPPKDWLARRIVSSLTPDQKFCVSIVDRNEFVNFGGGGDGQTQMNMSKVWEKGPFLKFAERRRLGMSPNFGLENILLSICLLYTSDAADE